MDISWDDARLFLAVVETGSLSSAARKLKVGQPTMSRRIALLEEQLGYPLFRRSVEGAVPTSDAERLLEPARRMAEWAGELERAAGRGDSAPRGLVRITAPPGVAFDFIAPFIGYLRTKLPEVRVEVISAVAYLDLGRREADLALRMRKPNQRDLVCVATLEHESAAFASTRYVRRLPVGYRVADVDWIAWAPPYERLSPNPELEALIPGFRPAFASDDFLVQRQAAEAGVGAMFLGRVRHRFSRPSALQPLELDLGGPIRSELHLVCARSALLVPRVRAVAEIIADELARVVHV
jgi:DNA-binding transcriptional LysR family regulator